MDVFCIKLIKLKFSIAWLGFESINGNSVYPKFIVEMYNYCIFQLFVQELYCNSVDKCQGQEKAH